MTLREISWYKNIYIYVWISYTIICVIMHIMYIYIWDAIALSSLLLLIYSIYLLHFCLEWILIQFHWIGPPMGMNEQNVETTNEWWWLGRVALPNHWFFHLQFNISPGLLTFLVHSAVLQAQAEYMTCI
jgi:hypothetical protein